MIGELLLTFNLCINLLIIIVCSRLLDERVYYPRAIIASFLSSCCSVLLPQSILATIIAFVLLQFGFKNSQRLLKIVYVLVITFLLGGMFTALDTYVTSTKLYYTVLTIGVAIFVLIVALFVERLYTKQLLQRYVVGCEVVIGSQKIACKGFIDTGNQSFEPLSGRAIHFAHIEILNPLSELQQAFQLWDVNNPHDVSMFPKTLQKSLHPIYVTTIEQQHLVLALSCTLNVEETMLEKQFIVFVEQPLQIRQQVQVILNAAVIKTIKGDRYCYEA